MAKALYFLKLNLILCFPCLVEFHSVISSAVLKTANDKYSLENENHLLFFLFMILITINNIIKISKSPNKGVISKLIKLI
ncbi:hypothetical protein D0T08_03845 [Emticicia sp. C21]|nr:hypothetical protein D0T08_03845 [Emticicia sp. C21]